MGDRCNVVVRQQVWPKELKQPNDVWFYMHWGGESYIDKTRAALKKKWRWNDDNYLARIIFDELVDGHHGEENYFGISCSICDNEHPILVVDVPLQLVYFVNESELVDGRLPMDYQPKKSETFGEFIGMDKLAEEIGKARA